MDKRVIIFSPELKDRERIKVLLGEYLIRNFKEYLKDMRISEFYDFREISNINWKEVLIVFDKRLLPETRIESFRHASRETFGESLLRTSFEGTKKLCDEKGIPYAIYEEELTKREEMLFIARLDEVKEKIRKKLEDSFLF